MDIGVPVAPSVPHLWAVAIPLMGIAALGLVVMLVAMRSKKRGVVIAGGSALAVGASVLIAFLGVNMAEIKKTYDYPGTMAALEARYGVSLSPGTKATFTMPIRGEVPIISQKAAGSVIHRDGTIRDDVFLQYLSGPDEQRIALVVPAEATNVQVATTSTWWPELPLAR